MNASVASAKTAHSTLNSCLLLFAIVSVAALSVAAEEPTQSLTSEQAKALAVDVTVRLIDASDQMFGSGVVIGISDREFFVLTAQHVVSAAKPFRIRCYEPRIANNSRVVRDHSSVEVIAQDAGCDLALVRVKSGIPAAASAILVNSRKIFPKEFSKAWTVDWTGPAIELANSPEPTRRQARRSNDAMPMSFWVLNTPSKAGMSGGPLLSSSGALMGIASGNSDGHAYYVDEAEIASFLETHTVNSPKSTPPDGHGN